MKKRYYSQQMFEKDIKTLANKIKEYARNAYLKQKEKKNKKEIII